MVFIICFIFELFLVRCFLGKLIVKGYNNIELFMNIKFVGNLKFLSLGYFWF